jgi:hypothetical protein
MATRLPSCLDIHIEPITDPAAVGPVLSFNIGNRCDHRMWVDFSQIEVEGRDAEGQIVVVAAQDPRLEIQPGWVPARWFIRENLEFRPVPPAEAPLAELCVDPSRLEPNAAPHSVCMRTP